LAINPLIEDMKPRDAQIRARLGKMRTRINEQFIALRMESCDSFSAIISRFSRETYISIKRLSE